MTTKMMTNFVHTTPGHGTDQNPRSRRPCLGLRRTENTYDDYQEGDGEVCHDDKDDRDHDGLIK